MPTSTNDVPTQMRNDSQILNSMITVSEIECGVRQQFQDAAFDEYKEAIITYGRQVWIESRSVAHHRAPDADLIEITTPDVKVATIRVEMKLARVRQLRYPFRLIQGILTLFMGIIAKYVFDLWNLPQTSAARGWFPWVFCIFLALIFAILTVNYYESKAEILR